MKQTHAFSSENKSKRKLSRLTGGFKVQYDWLEKTENGVVVNFSESGLFIESTHLPDPGILLQMKCVIHETENFILQGKVAWIRKNPISSINPEPKGFGFEITQKPIKYISFVKQYRKYLETHQQKLEDKMDVFHKVTFSSGNRFLSEYCENLSRGGMYLATNEPLQVGKVIYVKLEVPEIEKPICVEGKVAFHIASVQTNLNGKPTGVGIQFVDLSPESTAHISHYIKRLEIRHYVTNKRNSDSLPTTGSLNDYLVPEILISLLEMKATGILELKNQSTTKTVYIKNGEPVYVSSPLQSESLGHYLVKEHVIDSQTIENYTFEPSENDLHDGENLVRAGLITSNTLAQYLVSHHEDKLSNTFPWFEGKFEFQPTTEWPEHLIFYPLQIYSVVLSGIRRWYDSAVIQAWAGLNETSLVSQTEMSFAQAKLPTFLVRILRHLAKPITVQQLAFEVEQPIEELLPVVFATIISGFVSLSKEHKKPLVSQPHTTEEKPTQQKLTQQELAKLKRNIEADYKRIHHMDFFEIFRLQPGFNELELSKKYFELTKPYNDKVIGRIEEFELKRKTLQIRSSIQLAYETLKDPHTRQIYARRGKANSKGEKKLQHLYADRILWEAIRHINKGDFDRAIDLLQEGTKTIPEDATLLGYLGWTLFQKDPATHLRRACELIDTAVIRSPADSQLRYFQGEINMHFGNWEEAELCFSKAIELQPNFIRAEAAFEQAKEKRITLERMARQKEKE